MLSQRKQQMLSEKAAVFLCAPYLPRGCLDVAVCLFSPPDHFFSSGLLALSLDLEAR